MLLVIFPAKPTEQTASCCLFLLQYGLDLQHLSMAFMFKPWASEYKIAVVRRVREMRDTTKSCWVVVTVIFGFD